MLHVQEGCDSHSHQGEKQVISSLDSVILHALEMLCAVIIHNVCFTTVAVSKDIYHRPIIFARSLVSIVGASGHIIIEEVITRIVSLLSWWLDTIKCQSTAMIL